MQTVLIPLSIQVLRPQGCLNAVTAPDFQEQLTSALAVPGSAGVLVDFEQIESLDTAGLMVLVSALRLANSLERRFSLCSVSASIRIIFELSRLDQVFEIFDDYDQFKGTLSSPQNLS